MVREHVKAPLTHSRTTALLPEGRARLRHSAELFRTSFPAMGTVIDVTGTGYEYDDINRAQIADSLAALALDREYKWSKFLPTSEVSQLNASAGTGTPVAVSDETQQLLAQALYFAHATGEVASPTVGALTALWDVRGWLRDLARGIQRPLPDPAVVAATRAQCAAGALTQTIDGRFLLAAGCSLDLGYIAKGVVADELRERALELGLSAVVVSVGTSSVSVAGQRAPEVPWRVGIRSLSADPLGIIGSIDMASGQSLATSGDYLQRLPDILDGQVVHHLIDPRTGYPAASGVRQATVVAENGTVAEVASLVLAITGTLDRRLWPQVEWLTIGKDGVKTSAGLRWHPSN
ncbi:MAG: FAD:protein FMN transferase [Actinomycetaceae bacterium]|nr:FAD:protein FMN transferase [Actinomycetaceae bacterium]